MSNEQMHAEAETAWALALVSDEAVQALCLVAPKEIIRMAWMLGHYKGRIDGTINAEVKYAEAMIQRDRIERHSGRPDQDTTTRGDSLKPGR